MLGYGCIFKCTGLSKPRYLALNLHLFPHPPQALVSRARGFRRDPAGNALCPSHPSLSTALTCRPWSATRPTPSSPCSTIPAPARLPAALTVTSRLGPSGKNFPECSYSSWLIVLFVIRILNGLISLYCVYLCGKCGWWRGKGSLIKDKWKL